MTEKQYLKDLETPDRVVDVILDTDTYNEIDDQFALSYLLRSPERVRMKGFTAAPFFNPRSVSPADGMEKSYREILKLLDLAGRSELKELVFRGSTRYLPDEKTPVPSDAAEFIAKTAAGYTPEEPLYVISIGAFTNAASAILLDPSIADKVVLIILGGNAWHWPPAKEFNLSQDIAAGRVLFGCGAPLVQLPCAGVVDHVLTSRWELEHWLVGKNPLADYLAKCTIDEAESYAAGKPWTRVIWDITAAAWLLNDGGRFMKEELVPVPVPEYDNTYSHPDTSRMMKRVLSIDRDRLFEDLFRKLTQ